MKILYVGEIVGKPGIFTTKNLLPELREQTGAEFIIANADGATGGYGLGRNHAFYLRKLGIDAMTGGEWIYHKKDLQPLLPGAAFLLRPANFPQQNPGRGVRVFEVRGSKIAVVNLLGQASFSRTHLANPFAALDAILERLRAETPVILVDFHAAATAEKTTMFFHAEGRVSAVIGSHGRIQTADEKVLPGGTAVITDAGRTGSQQSVGGFRASVEIKKFLTGVPERSEDCWDGLELQGVLLDIDSRGKAVSIERVKKKCKEVPHDAARNSDED